MAKKDKTRSVLENMPPLNITVEERYGYPGCAWGELMEDVGKPLSWDLIEKQLAAKNKEEADDAPS